MSATTETLVRLVNDKCSIVDRSETRIVGIGLQGMFENRGYSNHTTAHGDKYLNDYFFTKKLISEGEIALLARVLGLDPTTREVITARYESDGNGTFKVIVGLAVDTLENLPEYLPEHATTLVVPASRFARILINEKRLPDRPGYSERMSADEYFVNTFRTETQYVYDCSSYPLGIYDMAGDMLAKYEPIKVPASNAERFDSIRFRLVTLPPMKIACCVAHPDSGEQVIAKYFEIEQQVYATDAAKYYGLPDYYGFPVDTDTPPQYISCFGSRVSSFTGLPKKVEKLTLPGGLYLHITQMEINGDNPVIPYDVAFNHLDELYLNSHPDYVPDGSRKVIARFRQANHASIFVPMKPK